MEKRKHSEIDTEYDAAAVTSATMSREDGPASPMHEDVHQQPLLRGLEPILEPLKVCLDDDSSIEDGDEDMFDDDAFYFGDEDFAALMSHESMKRRASAPASAALANQSSLHPPLHHSASMFNDHIGIVTASSSSTTALSSTSTGTEFLRAKNRSSTTFGDTLLLSSFFPYVNLTCLSVCRIVVLLGPKLNFLFYSFITYLPTASLGNLTASSSHTSCNSSLSKKSKSKRRVSLHNNVAVMPIPSRKEYPNSVKERLWSSANDLYRNAVRNSIEFASEGWNWRNVADDEQMIQSPSGERIHPIHVMNATADQEQEKGKGEIEFSKDLMDSEPLSA
ncbi:hypothetical protein ACHAWT_001746 [Skeletonema menzelii]